MCAPIAKILNVFDIRMFAVRAPTVFEYLTSNAYESPLCSVFATIEENWDVIANSGKSVFFLRNNCEFSQIYKHVRIIKIDKGVPKYISN